MATEKPVKRNNVAIFIKGKDDLKYIRLCKSEQLDIALNPNIVTKQYICDEQSKDEVESYKITLAQEVATVKGSEDYDAIFKIFYERPTGADAERECIIAFMTETSDNTNFLAWQTTANIVINNNNPVDGKIYFNINFGDVIKGSVTMLEGQPTFKPAEEE